MPKHLTVGQLIQYRRDGATFPLSVLSAEEAAAHRARLEAAEAVRGPLHYTVKPYLIFGPADALARHPALLDAVEDVLGPDILLWDSAYVIKEADDRRHVAWHQDLTYWGLDSDEVVTAWVALTPANSENGGMRYLPGSHREGRLAHVDTYADDSLLHRGQDASAHVDPAEVAADIVLRPGEASLHHGWTLHASGPNPSSDRRIGLTLQYVTPRVRQTLTDEETATLVRGRDSFGHFRPEPAFAGDFAPAALAFQAQAERLKKWVYDQA
ncbi:MAG: phytanoyl-CoA dioxygenase family protein [Kiloniellales bacterium]|nr:phytanoyl-CoA dioxygenase family protein [Kiloniellales bacterium]